MTKRRLFGLILGGTGAIAAACNSSSVVLDRGDSSGSTSGDGGAAASSSSGHGGTSASSTSSSSGATSSGATTSSGASSSGATTSSGASSSGATTSSTSSGGTTPVLAGTVAITQPGDDLIGSAIAFGNGGLYYALNFKPGPTDINPSDAGEALVGELALPLVTGASPVWQADWPNFAPGSYSCNCGCNANQDFLVAVSVGPDGVYFAGQSESATTDAVGCKEHKEIVVKYDLNGTPGPALGGALWQATQRFYPGGNGYDGDEGFRTSRVSVENGAPFFYGAGDAQLSGCAGTSIVRKYDTGGNMVWEWQEADTSCGHSLISGVLVSGTSLFASGASTYDATAPVTSVPLIYRFGTSSGGSGPSATFKGTVDPGYTFGLHASLAVLDGNLYAAGALGVDPSGETYAYLAEGWTSNGSSLFHNAWSSSASGANDQQLLGITAVGTRLFAVGYTRNADHPTVVHNTGEGSLNLPGFYSAPTWHGYADGVLIELSPTDGHVISTTSYGANDGYDEVFTGVTTDGTDLFVIGAERDATGHYHALVLRYTI